MTVNCYMDSASYVSREVSYKQCLYTTICLLSFASLRKLLFGFSLKRAVLTV
jgi:hypothetical protein